MNEFVFLYRGGEQRRSPERAQQMMQKRSRLADSGHVKDRGQPLGKGLSDFRVRWSIGLCDRGPRP